MTLLELINLKLYGAALITYSAVIPETYKQTLMCQISGAPILAIPLRRRCPGSGSVGYAQQKWLVEAGDMSSAERCRFVEMHSNNYTLFIVH